MLQSESYSPLGVLKNHTAMNGEKSFRASAPRLWKNLTNHIKLAASKDIFLKPIYLNWHIYNFKPVYYVWNVVELYELRMYFKCKAH